MAGAPDRQFQPEAGLIKAIREAGLTPVQRNTFYEPIKVWEGDEAKPAAITHHSVILEENLATA